MTAGLRRDLGTLEAYAALIGVLIGAGIFKVTSTAWELTGPSVILAYVVLAPMILATSVAYSVFLSTPLGREPGGEYTHISRTFGGYGVAFVGAWLKVISYIGALAFLARVFADYLLELTGGSSEMARPLAIGSLLFFYAIHVAGVKWFGRLQVIMCVLLGVSLVTLIAPGLFAIHRLNYTPFFTHGFSGFAASLAPLFFAYAGFESLAQTAGEVRDSTHKLPRIFVRGIAVTTVIYALMSIVAFGVLPGLELRAAAAPMTAVAARYLPIGATALVTLGAVMALATSLNATMLVPSRIAIMLAGDRLAPRWLGTVWSRTGTPVNGLTATLIIALLLLVSGQVSLALNIAVLALVILYLIHSIALLMLPRANPSLFRDVTVPLSRQFQATAAVLSIVSMAALIVVQLIGDVNVLSETTFQQRIVSGSLTSIELIGFWGVCGAVIYLLGRVANRGAAGRIEDAEER